MASNGAARTLRTRPAGAVWRHTVPERPVRSGRPRGLAVAANPNAGYLRAHTEKSPLVRMTQTTNIKIETSKSLPYELDGGARPKTDTSRVEIVPHAVTIRVVSRATG